MTMSVTGTTAGTAPLPSGPRHHVDGGWVAGRDGRTIPVAETYNVVAGLGSEAGHALAAHPGIGSLTFTGSVTAGRSVLRAAVTEHVTPEAIDHHDVAQMWPTADLEPFAAFAWEARGGYGDAYQTAHAFAAAARRAGARLRQSTTATAIRSTGERVTAVELADGTISFAPLEHRLL